MKETGRGQEAHGQADDDEHRKRHHELVEDIMTEMGGQQARGIFERLEQKDRDVAGANGVTHIMDEPVGVPIEQAGDHHIGDHFGQGGAIDHDLAGKGGGPDGDEGIADDELPEGAGPDLIAIGEARLEGGDGEGRIGGGSHAEAPASRVLFW